MSGTSAAQARGIALHLVVDRTPSMGSSFSEIRSGVDQYLTAQAALTGTDVGLSFAPLKNGSASCSGAGYDPPEVPFGPLPGHANAITNALQGLNTGGMPKLVAVLQGGSAALTSFTPAGDKQPVLAVITDWQPFSDGCSSSSSTLTAAAAAALSTPPHTMTWILDLGGQSSTLDGIAKSGGSEKALDNIDNSSEIRDALLEATRPCRFAAPPNSAGGALSLSRKSPSPQLYSEVSSIAACGNNNNRWFALGDTLVLCPRACNNQLNNAIYEINVACGS